MQQSRLGQPLNPTPGQRRQRPSLLFVHESRLQLGRMGRPELGRAMIRTGYVHLQVQTDHAGGSGYAAPANRRNVAHLDPLCSSIRYIAETRIVAVPLKVNASTAQLMMKPQHPMGAPIRTRMSLCKTCGHLTGTVSDDWMNLAACSPKRRPHGPGFEWVGVPGDADFNRYRHDAKRSARLVCWYECPVRDECEHYAAELSLPFGVWGGHSLRGKPLERETT